MQASNTNIMREPLPDTEDVNAVIERLKNTRDEFGERVNAIEAQVS